MLKKTFKLNKNHAFSPQQRLMCTSVSPTKSSSFYDKKIKYREEKDSMGVVMVSSQRLWGAQTQRSMRNFNICRKECFMPYELIKAIAVIKKSAAIVNSQNNFLSEEKCLAIVKAADEIIDNKLRREFPLGVFQTGSGTQTNMNVNEVIANRAAQIMGKPIGDHSVIHPNDDVNKCQSSNDTIPTAMNISAYTEASLKLFPAIIRLITSLSRKSLEFKDIYKIGRTHMMDATPMTLGNEFKTFAVMIQNRFNVIKSLNKNLLILPQGGTAVGTGINTFENFNNLVVKEIKSQTGFNFKESECPAVNISSHDDIVAFHGALNDLAVSLLKISNDLKLLNSGPRCGIGEITLPANEPGSSIMPGKVNPTQCESLGMVCAQVMGNNVTVTIAGSSGQLQLNAFKPVIIDNVLKSIKLLSYSINSFATRCIEGIKPNSKKIKEHLQNSLMLATALNPVIGYEKAAECAKKAFNEGTTLKEAALELGLVDEKQFDKAVDYKKLAKPLTNINSSKYIKRQKSLKEYKEKQEAEKNEDSVKADKAEKVEDSVKDDKAEKIEDSVKDDKAEKVEDSVKDDKAEKIEDSVKDDKAEKVEDSVKAKKAKKAKKSKKVEKSKKAKIDEKSDNIDKIESEETKTNNE